MAADEDRVVLLFPGRRSRGRIIIVHDMEEGDYTQPTNLIAENHLWEIRGKEGKETMKNTSQNMVQRIAQIRPELHERFTVKRIGVFGSCARGDESSESDVDIIVELAEPTFDNYMDLKFRLEELLQRPVDLVMADTVKPRLKPIIEKEVIYA